MVKTLPSNAGRVDLMPGGELRSPMPCNQKNVKQRQKQFCNNSIETLKMVHIKKMF